MLGTFHFYLRQMCQIVIHFRKWITINDSLLHWFKIFMLLTFIITFFWGGRWRQRRNGRHSQCQIHHAEELCVLDDNTVSETLHFQQTSHDITHLPKISSSITQKKICRKCGYTLWYVLVPSAHYSLYPAMHIQLLVVKFSSYSEI